MALAIDASTPAIATNSVGATAPLTTASFTPPANSLLLVRWAGNSVGGVNPSAPTITDSLGTPLTYNLVAWQSRADSPTVDGQSAAWWAKVSSSTAMTVTVTSGVSGSTNRQAALHVTVLTGHDTTTPIGASGKAGSASAAAIAQSYTATTTGGWGFIVDCDWDDKGAETAGTGCTLTNGGSNSIPGQISYGFLRRTSADDTAGGSNTLNVTLPGTSTTLSWVYIEVVPPGSASLPPWNPQRAVPARDPGESWWLQRSGRFADLVATAANDLALPLLVPEHQRSEYAWSTLVSRRMVPQQRTYYDPTLLNTAQLENELLGGGDERRRRNYPADFVDRREVPQQRAYISPPDLLNTALLENELLGSATTALRANTAAYEYSRREVPQQRLYISPPDLLTTALLENELLGGATYEQRYNTASAYTDRREVPQQRRYISPPDLLSTAQLENELLGGSTTWWRASTAATNADRREVPQQRLYISDPSFYPTTTPTDPLTVAWGAGGPLWWLYNTAAAQVSRREMPQQRAYVSDPSLLLSALLENELLGGGDSWRHQFAALFANRRETVQQRVYNDLTLLAEMPFFGDAARRLMVALLRDQRLPLQLRPLFPAGSTVPTLIFLARAHRATPRWETSDASRRWLVGDAEDRWVAEEVSARWLAADAPTRWEVPVSTDRTISSGSLELFPVTVRAVNAGALVDISATTVTMAFTQDGDTVPPTAFFAASWATDTSASETRYEARCLIGPGGAVTLTAGIWQSWVKVASAPETPLIRGPLLTIVD